MTPTPSSSAFISKEFCPTDVQIFFFHSYTISKLCTGLNSKQLRSNVVYDARLQNALYIQGWRQDWKCGGHNLPPLFEIGLTNLKKSGWACAPLAPLFRHPWHTGKLPMGQNPFYSPTNLCTVTTKNSVKYKFVLCFVILNL